MDAKVTEKAEAQFGVIGREQAIDLGMTARSIKQHVHMGRLISVKRGVYRIPGAPRTWDQRVVAAWLASAGPTHIAAVAGRTAAALHQFHGYPRDGIPVLCTPRKGSPRNNLATVITCTDLRSDDCQTLEGTGLLVTTATRTVLDLSLGARHAQQLDRLLDRSLLDRRTTLPDLWEALLHVADSGKRGVVQVRGALQQRSNTYVPLESELEHLAAEALGKTRLPLPVRQHPLPGAPYGRVDLAFPSARLVIELDGSQHRLPEHRRADYERDIAAARVGWMVLRFDWSHVRFRAPWFAASVEAVHRHRSDDLHVAARATQAP